MSEGEVVALFVAQKALAQYRGTSFEKPLRTAFEKISEGLQDRIGFQWGEVDAGISFRGLGVTVADLELFEKVSRAVLESHELAFEYQKLRSSRHEARRVQPYHLGCIENQWYLFGFDLARQQLRTFALPRMLVDEQVLVSHLREESITELIAPVLRERTDKKSTRWLSWRPLTAAVGIVLGMFCTSVVFAYAVPRACPALFVRKGCTL